MILCPNCQHHEVVGALFCSECGAQLVFTERLSTQAFIQSPAEEKPAVNQTANGNLPSTPVSVIDSAISINLVDNNQVLPLTGKNEFTIGRIAEGQPILPDIDLSAYDAYAQGVSRLHAAIKINNQRVAVMDLGSSNGTRVNGQKIIPNIDYPVNHGDMIALGKFRIQIYIRH